jgi:ethanolamine ammonia-lyase small subunit
MLQKTPQSMSRGRVVMATARSDRGRPTYGPRVGHTDAERNCIYNSRPERLGYEAAAQVLARLMTRARQLRLTGVGLKDDGGRLPLQ